MFATSGKQLSGRQLQTLSVSRHHQLLYNMGVQLLHCGRPAAAFDCLIETMQLYHISPRLWLRLAECCIQTHKNVSRSESISIALGFSFHFNVSCFLNALHYCLAYSAFGLRSLHLYTTVSTVSIHVMF